MNVFPVGRFFCFAIVVLVYSIAAKHMAVHAADFHNLDFEGTLIDVESLSSEHPFNNPDISNPAIVIPGWSLRTETLDHTEAPLVSTHGALIIGHIGTSPQVVMTIRDFPWRSTAYQGNHSLLLGASIDAPPPVAYYPVAYQVGTIPSNAKSILIQADDLPLDAVVNSPAAPHFSIRFGGYEVEMHKVDFSDFGDVYAAQQWSDSVRDTIPESQHEAQGVLPPLHNNIFYAGNISSISGLTREMAIRPESYLFDPPTVDPEQEPFYVDASVTIDNLLFSSSLAPGPPVQVPEPATLWGVLGSIIAFQMSRRR